MAFDWKKMLADYAPYLLALGGGYASYRFLGKSKPTYQPYLYGAGGVVAGYAVGKLVSGYLKPAPAALPPAQLSAQLPVAAPQQQPVGLADGLWDLDAAVPPPKQLPAPQQMATQPAVAEYEPVQPPGDLAEYKPDVRADTASDWNLLNSMGTFATSGQNGMGSYDSNVDEAAIEEALSETKKSRRGRA